MKCLVKSDCIQCYSCPLATNGRFSKLLQVENVRTKILQEQRIFHDTLYNLNELAIEMPDFIHQIKTFPDVVCVCGQIAMLQELDHVLLVKSPSPQLLSYDTSFLQIHERKFQPYHEEFLATCTKLAHSL